MAKFAIPNVVYNCRINMNLNIPPVLKNRKIELESFNPTYTYRFSDFESVLLDQESFIRGAVSFLIF